MFGPIPAVVIGTTLLLAVIVAVLVVAARRPDRLTLLVGLTILALAFYVVPTRVHERYAYPVFALAVILAAIAWRWRVAYLVLAVTIFLNMYVALTNPFYANPGIKDWLGIGNLVRSEPIIAVIALVNGIAFVWTLAQLRPRARDRLEDELAEASTDDGDGATYRPSPSPGVAVGSGLALVATVATWFLVVAIISEVNASELHIQAATGLLAIVVLLVVMNWFFHKIYWTGWIAHHDKRRRRILESTDATESSTFRGLALLGFTAIYREGFEVVLFLQNLRLRAGTGVVLGGTSIGLVLTAIVAALTFIAHRHLPYKKMLILTGVLLAGVLVVMVGESAQEMQLAGWLTTTPAGFTLPDWVGMWFAVFPNVEGLTAQAIAALLVLGSYVSAQYGRRWIARRA
jgi:high-affinity iron transporter